MKRNWTAEFNALPEPTRIIGCAQEAQVRIQQLGFEKDRLRKNYKSALAEIDEAIKTNKLWLERLEAKNK